MRLLIEDDFEGLSARTAAHIAACVTAAASSDRPFVLGVPGGNSVLSVYRRLVAMHKAGGLDMAHVVLFGLDEYCGIPKTHPSAQHAYLYEHLLQHVNVRRENVHLLDGNAADWPTECAAYEAAIAAAGGLDLVFFGTGPDGHVGRNEPGSSLHSRTRPKTLAYDTRKVLAARWQGLADGEEVPTVALTMGLGTLLEAKELVVLFPGVGRAHALERCLEHGVNHMFPVSVMQMHKRVCFVADEDATLELRVKTVRYFKGLTKTEARTGAGGSGAARGRRPSIEQALGAAVKVAGVEARIPGSW